MPGYGTSDEIAEMAERIKALEEEKRKLMNVDSCPTFKFALMDASYSELMPTRAHDTDTGWDVRAAITVTLYPFDHVLIPLGFQILAPKGWWLELRPRSSSHAKKHLHCLYGVIDEGYENQCFLSAQYIPPMNLISVPPDNYPKRAYGYDYAEIIPRLVIERGERIGQVIPVRRQEMKVEEVSGAEFQRLSQKRAGNRGGGLGSTG
jgi:dUTP pyrophosphatase